MAVAASLVFISWMMALIFLEDSVNENAIQPENEIQAYRVEETDFS